MTRNPASWRECPPTRLRRYCAVPSGDSGVGVGEALSAASGDGETAGDAASAGVTEGVAEVSEGTGTDASGSGLAKRLRADGRSRSPGIGCGVRTGRGAKPVAGFADLSPIEGRLGTRETPGTWVLPAAFLFSSSAFLRAVNSARRR